MSVFSDNHPSFVIPRRQNVDRRLLYCKRRYPVAPVLISKRDVESAFKLAPIAVCGLAYMGCRFAHFSGFIFLSSSGGGRRRPIGGATSTLAMQYIAARRPPRCRRDGPEGFVAFQYVDDGAFVDPWVGLRPWLASSLWEGVLRHGLGVKAANTKKRDVEGCSDTRVLLWGIDVCAATETSALPPAKALRAQEFLASADFDAAVTRFPIKKCAGTQR